MDIVEGWFNVYIASKDFFNNCNMIAVTKPNTLYCIWLQVIQHSGEQLEIVSFLHHLDLRNINGSHMCSCFVEISIQSRSLCIIHNHPLCLFVANRSLDEDVVALVEVPSSLLASITSLLSRSILCVYLKKHAAFSCGGSLYP